MQVHIANGACICIQTCMRCWFLAGCGLLLCFNTFGCCCDQTQSILVARRTPSVLGRMVWTSLEERGERAEEVRVTDCSLCAVAL